MWPRFAVETDPGPRPRPLSSQSAARESVTIISLGPSLLVSRSPYYFRHTGGAPTHSSTLGPLEFPYTVSLPRSSIIIIDCLVGITGAVRGVSFPLLYVCARRFLCEPSALTGSHL